MLKKLLQFVGMGSSFTLMDWLGGKAAPTLTDAQWWGDIQRWSEKTNPVFAWESYPTRIPEAVDLVRYYQTPAWGSSFIEGLLALGVYEITGDPAKAFSTFVSLTAQRSGHPGVGTFTTQKLDGREAQVTTTVGRDGFLSEMIYSPLEDPDPAKRRAHLLRMILHEGRHVSQMCFLSKLFARRDYPDDLNEGGELFEIDACAYAGICYAIYRNNPAAVAALAHNHTQVRLPGKTYWIQLETDVVPNSGYNTFGAGKQEQLADFVAGVDLKKQPTWLQPANAIRLHADRLRAFHSFLQVDQQDAPRIAKLLDQFYRLPQDRHFEPENEAKIEYMGHCHLTLAELHKNEDQAKEAIHLYMRLLKKAWHPRYVKYIAQAVEAIGVIRKDEYLVNAGRLLFADQYALTIVNRQLFFVSPMGYFAEKCEMFPSSAALDKASSELPYLASGNSDDKTIASRVNAIVLGRTGFGADCVRAAFYLSSTLRQFLDHGPSQVSLSTAWAKHHPLVYLVGVGIEMMSKHIEVPPHWPVPTRIIDVPQQVIGMGSSGFGVGTDNRGIQFLDSILAYLEASGRSAELTRCQMVPRLSDYVTSYLYLITGGMPRQCCLSVVGVKNLLYIVFSKLPPRSNYPQLDDPKLENNGGLSLNLVRDIVHSSPYSDVVSRLLELVIALPRSRGHSCHTMPSNDVLQDVLNYLRDLPVELSTAS